MEKIKQITEFWHFFYLIWADGAATKRPKSEENYIFLGGAVHFWRFTWQKVFLKKSCSQTIWDILKACLWPPVSPGLPGGSHQVSPGIPGQCDWLSQISWPPDWSTWEVLDWPGGGRQEVLDCLAVAAKSVQSQLTTDYLDKMFARKLFHGLKCIDHSLKQIYFSQVWFHSFIFNMLDSENGLEYSLQGIGFSHKLVSLLTIFLVKWTS